MTVSYWQTQQDIYEVRVYGNSPEELAGALGRMGNECRTYNDSTDAMTWRTDGDAIVISFPGMSQSGGWDPEA